MLNSTKNLILNQLTKKKHELVEDMHDLQKHDMLTNERKCKMLKEINELTDAIIDVTLNA